MKQISVMKPAGAFVKDDIVPGVGRVQDVVPHGAKDILICKLGDFGRQKQQAIRPVVQKKPVVQNVEKQQVQEDEEKIQVAKQKKNKKILDQSPSNKGKKLLRG